MVTFSLLRSSFGDPSRDYGAAPALAPRGALCIWRQHLPEPSGASQVSARRLSGHSLISASQAPRVTPHQPIGGDGSWRPSRTTQPAHPRLASNTPSIPLMARAVRSRWRTLHRIARSCGRRRTWRPEAQGDRRSARDGERSTGPDGGSGGLPPIPGRSWMRTYASASPAATPWAYSSCCEESAPRCYHAAIAKSPTPRRDDGGAGDCRHVNDAAAGREWRRAQNLISRCCSSAQGSPAGWAETRQKIRRVAVGRATSSSYEPVLVGSFEGRGAGDGCRNPNIEAVVVY